MVKKKQNRPSKANCEATAPPTVYELSFPFLAFRSQYQFKYVGSPPTATRSLSFYQKLRSGLDFKLTLSGKCDIKGTFHARYQENVSCKDGQYKG